jgi:hypothetical protein
MRARVAALVLSGWAVAATALLPAPVAAQQAAPKFQPEPFWPKPLPENWILGQVAGIAVDGQDNIWIIHRPATLLDDEKGAQADPPQTKCCKSAPPVLKFDPDGNLLASWGGATAGQPWVKNEHGIHVDRDGNVWLGGNNDGDQILKFTPEGKFLQQIGKDDGSKSPSSQTRLGRPAHMMTDPAANEIYVADGYGNHRVIVFDATTGAYKRHWGAYGRPPSDDKQPPYDPKGPVAQQFGNPVHCVKIATDGLVYVCDRINNRMQVFKKDGTFVKEWFFEKNTLGNGAVWDVAIWPDPKQTYLLSADGENNEIRVLRREDGAVVGTFGGNGRNAGQFHWIHAMAVDSKGNVYTGEVDTGKRIQKFKLTSDALR